MIMKRISTPIIDIKKYGGKQVAIVKGKIVASGRSTAGVLQRARRAVSEEDYDRIALLMVPKSLTVT